MRAFFIWAKLALIFQNAARGEARQNNSLIIINPLIGSSNIADMLETIKTAAPPTPTELLNFTPLTKAEIEARIIGRDPDMRAHIVKGILHLQNSNSAYTRARTALALKAGTRFAITEPDHPTPSMDEATTMRTSYSTYTQTVIIPAHLPYIATLEILGHEMGHAADHTWWLAHPDKKYHFSVNCYEPENKHELDAIIETIEPRLHELMQLFKNRHTLAKEGRKKLSAVSAFFTKETCETELGGLFVHELKGPAEQCTDVFLGFNDQSAALKKSEEYTHPGTGVRSCLPTPENCLEASLLALLTNLATLKEVYAPKEYAYEFITTFVGTVSKEFIDSEFPELATYLNKRLQNHPGIPTTQNLSLIKSVSDLKIAECIAIVANAEGMLFIEEPSSLIDCIHTFLGTEGYQTREAFQHLESALQRLIDHDEKNNKKDHHNTRESTYATMGKMQFLKGNHPEALALYLKHHANHATPPNVDSFNDASLGDIENALLEQLDISTEELPKYAGGQRMLEHIQTCQAYHHEARQKPNTRL